MKSFLWMLPMQLLFAFTSGAADAEKLNSEISTVIFKSGHTLEGQVLQLDDESLTLQVQFGSLKIPVNKILRIESETEEAKVLREQMEADGKVMYRGKWIEKEEREKQIADAKAKLDKTREATKQKKLAVADAKKKADAARLSVASAPKAGIPLNFGSPDSSKADEPYNRWGDKLSSLQNGKRPNDDVPASNSQPFRHYHLNQNGQATFKP